MGANPTQAVASLLFMLAFVLITFGCYQGYGIVALAAGIVLLGYAVMLFRRAKPWEELNEEGTRI